MTRTLAPKDLGGRLDLNCARTAPELPVIPISVSTLLSQPQPLLQISISNAHISSSNRSNPAGLGEVRTVRAGDGAPDSPDLRATDVLVGAVDEGDLLATVEARKKHRLSKSSSLNQSPQPFLFARRGWVRVSTYLASSVVWTPSSLRMLVLGWTVRLPRT